MADREGARKTPEAMILSTCPDVCKTPMGPNLVPVPYSLVTYCSMSTGEAQTVNMTGCKVVTKATKITCVYGDEPGVGGGVKSGVNKAMAEFMSASSTVYCEGQPVIRHLDDVQMNNGNTVGKVQYPLAMGGGAAEAQGVERPQIDQQGRIQGNAAGPAAVPETVAEAAAAKEGKGFWGQVGGFFVGGGKAVYEMGEGIVNVVAHPVDTVTNLANADLGQLWDGVTQGYREAWASGNYGEAFGRGAVDIGSMLIGGAGAAGKAGKAGKIANAADKIGDAGRIASAADKVGDAGRVASAVDKVGDVGKVVAAGDKVGDTANVIDKASDSAKALGTGTDAAKVVDKGSDASQVADKTADAEKATASVRDGAVISKLPKGGSYGALRKQYKGKGKQMHHMPADSASPLPRNDGPAIAMDPADHAKTASYDNMAGAKEFREAQRQLIEQGKFRDAMQMDISDIQAKFGSKYDDAIQEMLDYTRTIGK
ncbi:MAG: DUF4150 domain-containing protein [Verrucomicrobiales bacterium]|nr:DUF4150 domain-containing protein [Verrucomicrobiales bacterium]